MRMRTFLSAPQPREEKEMTGKLKRLKGGRIIEVGIDDEYNCPYLIVEKEGGAVYSVWFSVDAEQKNGGPGCPVITFSDRPREGLMTMRMRTFLQKYKDQIDGDIRASGWKHSIDYFDREQWVMNVEAWYITALREGVRV